VNQRPASLGVGKYDVGKGAADINSDQAHRSLTPSYREPIRTALGVAILS
jgi:hypothetical protein